MSSVGERCVIVLVLDFLGRALALVLVRAALLERLRGAFVLDLEAFLPRVCDVFRGF